MKFKRSFDNLTTFGIFCVNHLNSFVKANRFLVEIIQRLKEIVKNKNCVNNYSPSCRFKPARPLFIFRTQIKILIIVTFGILENNMMHAHAF